MSLTVLDFVFPLFGQTVNSTKSTPTSYDDSKSLLLMHAVLYVCIDISKVHVYNIWQSLLLFKSSAITKYNV